ncbi:fumarylacetoacetase [Pseudarthrobacter psychrotolerans]|uniref:fumarylacetoacetase n=1 Tax=Pseudarthrobacter psychrotolerans TaxID=2697569 RepID=A0A6P1NJA6_9MICC|nr:fumarylacetoacetase [Pseudarthrobacter psychrotolerans]QHK18554.1 fumarylacetoacetase [Pseudarthrobacter psychrotolerans]
MTTAAEAYSRPGFGTENLPYGSFSTPNSDRRALGVRLGERVVDLAGLASAPGLPAPSNAARAAIDAPNLDALLAAGHTVWTDTRAWILEVLAAQGSGEAVAAVSHVLADVTLHLPFTVADYVDGYASEHHAANIGKMFRPDQPPLLPNWKHLPVGYHGRSGTIGVSGMPIRRPKGLRPEPGGSPSFGPSRRLDIEAELGFVLGGAAPEGEIALVDAPDHLFGVVILNDWSARDIQNYEYVPLGPYLGKSFASSISPWVVPVDALKAGRVSAPNRDTGLEAYLDDTGLPPWGLDVTLEVLVDGVPVSYPPAKGLYWTAPQMIAHMTVNGAALRPGDFIGSGTISGPEPTQRGSFMELSWGGAEPFALPDGRTMSFLEDGQSIVIRATAPAADGGTIDFGEVEGTILPATLRPR